MTRKQKSEAKMISTNQGYWDGVADRENGRMAKWYRGAHSTYGHFNADYANGYNLGLFNGEAPEGAIIR